MLECALKLIDMKPTLSVDPEGLAPLMKKLESLVEPRKQLNVIRAGQRKSAKPILAAAIAHAPVRHGFLRDSLTLVVKVIKTGIDKGLSSVRVGVDSRKISMKTGGTGDVIIIDGKRFRPQRYVHLVEFGTKKAKASGFMRKAANEAGGAAQVQIFATYFNKAVARVMKRKLKG